MPEEKGSSHLLRLAAKNMCWIAQTVHQAHHQDVAGETSPANWRDCSRGACRSMESMLGQVGFDKNLRPVPVLP